MELGSGSPRASFGTKGWTWRLDKDQQKGWGTEVGLHRALGYAGEVVIGVEVSHLYARESAYQNQPSKETVQL